MSLRDEIGDLPAWMAEGRCLRSDVDPDLFFGHGDDVDEAKRLCAECPVRTECLAHALANGETQGVWGGKDEHELHAIRREIRQRQRARDAG